MAYDKKVDAYINRTKMKVAETLDGINHARMQIEDTLDGANLQLKEYKQKMRDVFNNNNVTREKLYH
jgi:F0F1-type ATP synthase membrane subunit b/b'